MPYPIYNIGDYIKHDDFGRGIIVGRQNCNGQPIHHARFFSKSHQFKYIDDADATKVQLEQIANNQTILAAQNLLMDLFVTHSYNHPYRYVGESINGDIINHPEYGPCLIIGGNELGIRNQKTRHIYAYRTDRFYYIDNPGLPILKTRTSDTIKEAHNLWLSRILPQPFDAENMP